MENKISESIFDGATTIIPMADIQHVNKHNLHKGCTRKIEIITDKTKYNFEVDYYENSIFLLDIENGEQEATEFMKAWTYYRYEKDIKQKELV